MVTTNNQKQKQRKNKKANCQIGDLTMSKDPPQQLHQPVLLEHVLRLLNPQVGESYLDLTAGYGGHAVQVLQKTKRPDKAVLVDQDSFAIDELGKIELCKKTKLLHQDFLSASQHLVAAGQSFDMVLVDLGVSSPQFDSAQRGFSLRFTGPLDMRMDQRSEKTASWLVNHLSVSELTQLIRRYGEEKPSRSARIAQTIVQARPVKTTQQLAQIIKQTYRGPSHKIHPATRTFQALRIATNDELVQLESLLPLLPKLLTKQGRVVIISFHSLEDRLVKRFLQDQARSGYEATLTLLNKKPVAGATDDVHNPRARSSKLRGASKK